MQWHCRVLWMILAFIVLVASSHGQQDNDEVEPANKGDTDTDAEDLQDGDNALEDSTATINQTDMTTDLDRAVAPLADETTSPTNHPGPEEACSATNDDNKVCAAVKIEASLSVNYHGKDGKNLTDEQTVPDDIKCSGHCAPEPVVILEWSDYKLTMEFDKLKDGDWWGLKSLSLEISPAEIFKIDNEEKTVTLEAKADDLEIFSAPINQSLACSEPQKVPLFSESGMLSAYAVLNEARMQAYNVPSEFGPEYTCNLSDESEEEKKPKRTYRDDTAPIAVGSTLAILSIGVIAGYAIYRSLTNKKVEYATM